MLFQIFEVHTCICHLCEIERLEHVTDNKSIVLSVGD